MRMEDPPVDDATVQYTEGKQKENASELIFVWKVRTRFQESRLLRVKLTCTELTITWFAFRSLDRLWKNLRLHLLANGSRSEQTASNSNEELSTSHEQQKTTFRVHFRYELMRFDLTPIFENWFESNGKVVDCGMYPPNPRPTNELC